MSSDPPLAKGPRLYRLCYVQCLSISMPVLLLLTLLQEFTTTSGVAAAKCLTCLMMTGKFISSSFASAHACMEGTMTLWHPAVSQDKLVLTAARPWAVRLEARPLLASCKGIFRPESSRGKVIRELS